MKQLLENLNGGDLRVQEVPCPQVTPAHLLIRTRASLISAGTESMLVEFGKANLVQKALQQPERVRQAWAKVKTDGVAATVDAVRARLDQPLSLGYCNAGVVLEAGAQARNRSPRMIAWCATARMPKSCRLANGCARESPMA